MSEMDILKYGLIITVEVMAIGVFVETLKTIFNKTGKETQQWNTQLTTWTATARRAPFE